MIYLDYNATTPVDDRVLNRMLPFFTEQFGNASSAGHAWGWAADEAVKRAREQAANALGADPTEIVFTSGATEALNFAIKGVAAAYASNGRHIITVQTEHKAVLDTFRSLEREGFRVTYLPVEPDGTLDPDRLAGALTDETILVAVMWANNETGVRHPISAISEIVRAHGALLLTDATQAIGKVPVSVDTVDLLACSGHKFYAPKGVGLLYLRRRDPRVRVVPLLDGGGQERGRRGGTLNTPGIVGLGEAIALATAEQASFAATTADLRDALETHLKAALPHALINGGTAPRLPNTCNITIPGVPARDLTAALRMLALSTGSACSTGSRTPSHVLTAMGVSADDARSTIRISLGRPTTREETAEAAHQIIAAVEQLQATIPHA